MIELALAATNATKIEPQGGKAALLEHVKQIVDDLVVHGPAKLRVRMQDNCDRGIFFRRRLISSL
jgi:hypothetical protein